MYSMLLPPLPDQPVMLADEGEQVQVNEVPATLDVSVRFVEELLQSCIDSGVFDRFGVG